METKIKNFLQSDFFILSISLLLGFLCHYFVATGIVTSEASTRNTKNLYTTLLENNIDVSFGKEVIGTH